MSIKKVIPLTLIATAVMVLSVCTMSDGDYIGENQSYVNEGWYCTLFSDGTAEIDKVGRNTQYDVGTTGTFDPKVIVPKIVTVGIRGEPSYMEYEVIGLGPGLFKGKGSHVFNDVFIPNTVKYIGDNCFEGNSQRRGMGLTIDFEEGSSLNKIGNFAFKDCINMGSVIVGLKEFDLPSSVKHIGDYAFTGPGILSKFTDMDLSHVEYIGKYAFASSGLTAENLKLDSAKYIGEYSFQNCKLTGEIDLSNCDSVDLTSFAGCTGATYKYGINSGIYEVSNSTGTFLLYRGDVTELNKYIPNEGQYPDKIIIPKDVVKITSGAFDPSKLKKVSLESGSKLVVIGENAFGIFGDTISPQLIFDFSNAIHLKSIENGAFSGNYVDAKMDLSACTELTSIGMNAFKMTSISEIIFPKSLKNVGDYAFAYTKITSMNISEVVSLETIGDCAFLGESGNSTLSELSLSGLTNLYSIGKSAFSERFDKDLTVSLNGCSALVSISDDAFYSKTYKIGIDLSGCASLATIGSRAWNDTAKYDASTPYAIDSQLNPGFASTGSEEGGTKIRMTIDETCFAITKKALNSKIDIIDLSKDNDRFKLIDGILYSYDGTVLIKAISSVSVIDLPSTLNTICSGAFIGCDSVSKITINSDIAIDNLPNCSNIIVNGPYTETISNLNELNKSFKISYSVGSYKVNLSFDIDYKLINPSISIKDNKLHISMNYAGGYSKYDVSIHNGTTPINYLDSGDWLIDVNSDMNLQFSARDRDVADKVKVTLNAGEGTFGDSNIVEISIPKGMSILDSEMKFPLRNTYSLDYWYIITASGNTKYDFDDDVTDSITLYASWKFTGVSVNFFSPCGEIIAESNGNVIKTGDIFDSGATLTLRFYPYAGYEFESWIVNGQKYDSRVLTLSDQTADLMISVSTSGYSSGSLKYLVVDNDSGIDLSKYTELWQFGGEVDTSMSNWSGHPSVPVVVGSDAYIRIGATLYKISIETGVVSKSVSSVSQTTFYHYVGYGNDMIVDYATGMVYDLDLNALYKLDGITSAYYSDGFFYCLKGKTIAAYDASDIANEVETKMPVWVTEPVGWFTLYGICSTPVFAEGFMYIICTNDKDIQIKSLNLSNGKIIDTVIFDKIKGHYLDDGWLTYYDGKLYLSSYAYGLFGSSVAYYKASVITSIDVKSGIFDDSSIVYTELTGFDSLTSQFVIFNGRGYVNTVKYGGTKPSDKALLVLDLETMSVIRSINTTVTHGSIVVDASTASADNDYKVQIYMIGYNDGSLYVVEDDQSNTASKNASKYFGGTYCSQSVRFGPGGELIWYDDSGNVKCYSTYGNERYFFVQNADESELFTGTGSSFTEALSDALSGSTMDSGIITYSGESYYIYYLGNNGQFVSIADGDYDKHRSFLLTTISDKNYIDGDSIWYHHRSNVSESEPVKYSLKSIIANTKSHSSFDSKIYTSYPEYIVTLDLNDGIINPSSSVFPMYLPEGGKLDLSDLSASKDGYKFTGWSCNGILYSSEFVVGSYDAVLSAVWSDAKKPVSDIKLDCTSMELRVGQSYTFGVTVLPGNANKNVSWISDNEGVVKINSNGRIEALKLGVATITAITEDGFKTATCVVEVVATPASSIIVSEVSTKKIIGDSFTLVASVDDAATDKTVTWSSGNAAIAIVDGNGKVTALSAGIVAITATSSNGLTATCIVTVAEKSVTGITLSSTSITLEVGKTSGLVATVSPSDAGVKTVIWSSSNSSVAMVDQNGNVTAVAAGSAVITAKTTDGDKTARCSVTVNGATVELTGLSLSSDSGVLSPGDSIKLTVSAHPSTAILKDVVWSSGNISVAEVSNGTVTAVAAGNATITVMVGGMSAVCNIIVTSADSDHVSIITDGSGDSASVTIPSSTMEKLSLINSDLELESTLGTVIMSGDVVSSLSKKGGDVRISMESVDRDLLTAVQKNIVGDSLVISLNAMAGGKSIHELGGKVTVTMPYNLKSGSNPNNIHIYYLSDNGTLTSITCVYNEKDKTVSFETDHFSYFLMSYEESVTTETGIDVQTILMGGILVMLVLIFGFIAVNYVKSNRRDI